MKSYGRCWGRAVPRPLAKSAHSRCAVRTSVSFVRASVSFVRTTDHIHRMEIFVMVRRAKLTMFLDCTEATTVSELKKMIEGIAKKTPEEQRLYKDEQQLEDNRTLGDYGFTSQTSRPQSPAMIGLACKVDGADEWESLNIASLSTPPDPPDVMIPQEKTQTELS